MERLLRLFKSAPATEADTEAERIVRYVRQNNSTICAQMRGGDRKAARLWGSYLLYVLPENASDENAEKLMLAYNRYRGNIR